MWMSMEDICAELGVKPRTLRDRVATGSIRRRPNPANGRKSQYQMTAAVETTTAAVDLKPSNNGAIRRSPTIAAVETTTAAVTAAVETTTAAVTAAVETTTVARTEEPLCSVLNNPVVRKWFGVVKNAHGAEAAEKWLTTVQDVADKRQNAVKIRQSETPTSEVR